MRDVEIAEEPIELIKLMKFGDIVCSGGEAKIMITEGQVLVNGEVETRKRKKIVAGDTVECGSEKIQIKLASTK